MHYQNGHIRSQSFPMGVITAL